MKPTKQRRLFDTLCPGVVFEVKGRSVSLPYEDGHPVDGKGVGRKVIGGVHETYKKDLDGKNSVYEGEKSLLVNYQTTSLSLLLYLRMLHLPETMEMQALMAKAALMNVKGRD